MSPQLPRQTNPRFRRWLMILTGSVLLVVGCGLIVLCILSQNALSPTLQASIPAGSQFVGRFYTDSGPDYKMDITELYAHPWTSTELRQWFLNSQSPTIEASGRSLTPSEDLLYNSYEEYDELSRYTRPYAFTALLQRLDLRLPSMKPIDQRVSCQSIKIYKNKDMFLKHNPTYDIPDGMSAFQIRVFRCYHDFE